MGQSNRSLLWIGFLLFGFFALTQGSQSNYLDLRNHTRLLQLELDAAQTTNSHLADSQADLRIKLLEVEEVRDGSHREVTSLREVVVERDLLKVEVAKLLVVVEERDQLLREVAALKIVALERDRLVIELKGRTVERDIFASRCDQMKKGLMALVGADEESHRDMLSAGLGGPLDIPLKDSQKNKPGRGWLEVVPASRIKEVNKP